MAFETVVESESSKKPTFPHEWFFLHSGLFVCCPMMTTLTWLWRHNTFCAVAPAFHGPRNGQLPFSGRGPLQLAPHSTDSFGWPFFPFSYLLLFPLLLLLLPHPLLLLLHLSLESFTCCPTWQSSRFYYIQPLSRQRYEPVDVPAFSPVHVYFKCSSSFGFPFFSIHSVFQPPIVSKSESPNPKWITSSHRLICWVY